MRKRSPLKRFQDGGYAMGAGFQDDEPTDDYGDTSDYQGDDDSDAQQVDTGGYSEPPATSGPLSSQDMTPFNIIQGRQSNALAILNAARDRAMSSLKPSHDNRAAWLAAAAGLLAPTRTGSFGESAGNAAGNVAPYVQHQIDADMDYKKTLAQSDMSAASQMYQYAMKPPQISEIYTPDGQKQKVMIIDGVPYPIGGAANPLNSTIAKYKWLSDHKNDPGPMGDVARVELNKTNSTMITLNNKQDPASDTVIGQGEGKDYVGYQQAGQNANLAISNMTMLGDLLQKAGTGKFTPTIATLQAYGKGVGLHPEDFGWNDKTAALDAASMLGNRIALQLRNPAGGEGMPGSLSDGDRRFLSEMVPNSMTQPEAIPVMVNWFNRLQQRNIELARVARDYKTKNNGHWDDGGYEVLQKYADEHPIFSSTDRENMSKALGSKPKVDNPDAGTSGADWQEAPQ